MFQISGAGEFSFEKSIGAYVNFGLGSTEKKLCWFDSDRIGLTLSLGGGMAVKISCLCSEVFAMSEWELSFVVCLNLVVHPSKY